MMEPTAASTSSGQATFTFIKRNGGSVLLRSGYQYYARRKHNSGLTVWACTNRQTCKGILRIKDQQILEETTHNHTPDFAKNEVEESLNKLKTKLVRPGFPNIPQVFNSMMGNLKDAGIDIVSEIPKFTNIKSTLYRHRNAEAGVTKMNHKRALEVEVPVRYQTFLLADYSNSSDNIRILVFSSMEARKIMCESRDFYGDGTFRSCPSPFVQLYTVHVDTGSTMNHTNIMPVIYALMSKRTAHSYSVLFQIIKSQIPNWNPITFKLDYEKAAMNAITEVFPSTVIKGCYYHFNKAIFKKGKELNMTSKTSKLPKEIRLVQLSAVLPLLPEQEIINGWVYIVTRYGDSNTNETKKFIEYMERQWIHEDFIKVWCVFGEAHRTTNALEAWHNKLNKTIGVRKPNIMHFLHTIKEDCSQNTVRNILRQQNKQSKRKREKKIVLKDEFVQEAQLELTQGLITIGHALEIFRN